MTSVKTRTRTGARAQEGHKRGGEGVDGEGEWEGEYEGADEGESERVRGEACEGADADEGEWTKNINASTCTNSEQDVLR